MSYPTIPNITPNISVTLENSVNMLLASIAMEEIALSHIMNAEGEKIQFALGTLFEKSNHSYCLNDIMAINKDVRSTLTNVIRTEIVLQLKLDAVLDLIHKNPRHHDSHHKPHHDTHHKHHHDSQHKHHHDSHRKHHPCQQHEQHYEPHHCSCDDEDFSDE